VAFTRHGQVIGLVDANGVLLSMSAATMAKRHYSFPVVTGIDPGDPADSRKARMALYQRLIAELDADGKHNSEQISEIDLTDPEDARVLMPEQGADILAHFGEDHFLERYQRYKAHIAEWRQQYPHLASVDLRYENQVVLQMASGTETAQTAPASDGGAGAAPAAAGDQSAPVPPVAPDAKGSADQKPGPSGPAAKKPKPAPNKKHAAQKRAALNKSGRNPVLKPHAASASHTTDKNPSSGAAAATQGG
jgi:cell division protein FtsQ